MTSQAKRAPGLLLPLLAIAGVGIGTVLAFFYAPTEALQGNVQRIFYVHAPSGITMYLAFGVAALASLAVLIRRDDWERWDRIAVSSTEVGLVFTSIVLVTGPIWGRRVWGVWWVWDARLTSTLVLWIVYAGYLLFRTLNPPGERRARLSAVIGIIGALDIPVIHFAVVWWRTLHPLPVVFGPSGRQLPNEMLLTFGIFSVAFIVLYAALVTLRIRIETARSQLDNALEAARV